MEKGTKKMMEVNNKKIFGQYLIMLRSLRHAQFFSRLSMNLHNRILSTFKL